MLWGLNNLDHSVGILKSNLVTTNLTPTRTIQVMQAGPMNVTVTFLDPVDVCSLQPVSSPTQLMLNLAIRLTTALASILLFRTRVRIYRWLST